jgi:hypothetical protein
MRERSWRSFQHSARGTQDNERPRTPVYCASPGGYNPPMSAILFRSVPLLLLLSSVSLVNAHSWLLAAADELEIAISKKGLGKEVVITQGVREWFMLVEVTPENTVIVRQEKDRDHYLVDESETHDRPLAPIEVDSVINDYINSVKARVPKK